MNFMHMYSWLYVQYFKYCICLWPSRSIIIYAILINSNLKFQVYRFGYQSDWGLIKLFEWRQMELFFVAIFGHFAIQNFDFNQ